MTSIQEPRRALITRVVEGAGRASQALRRAAFENTGLPEPLRTLISTVAENPHALTDAQVASAVAYGLSEDQLFEVLVCAAVGQATRQHDGALRALAAVVSED
jgi:alkylhydroperoxidase/carboxymuconolactone decarboxylase family protein YurZ